MPFPEFECQRCGECCRRLSRTTLSFTEEELREFEKDGVGSNLKEFRADSRVSCFGLGETNVYEVLDKQTALEVAGVDVALEAEGGHCAFFRLDENEVPACGMQLDYGVKPQTCRDFPLEAEHGVKFSDCEGCRLVLGEERSEELLREATATPELPEDGSCPF